jgi:hypothetical protein
MPTINDNQRRAVLVKNGASTALHLIVGNTESGMVFFVCEQSPPMTFQSYGSPKRCPICQQENPLPDERERE